MFGKNRQGRRQLSHNCERNREDQWKDVLHILQLLFLPAVVQVRAGMDRHSFLRVTDQEDEKFIEFIKGFHQESQSDLWLHQWELRGGCELRKVRSGRISENAELHFRIHLIYSIISLFPFIFTYSSITTTINLINLYQWSI